MLGTKLEPWFVAVDVFRALDIPKNYIKRTLDRLDDDEKSVVDLTTEANTVTDHDGNELVVTSDYHPEDVADCDASDELVPYHGENSDSSVIKLMTEQEKIKGNHNMVYIVSEPGLYKIMLRSRTPTAEAFTRFVTHEVLPQIRKTGKYIPPQPKRGVGRPALPMKTYEISTGERKSLNGLRVMCSAFERPEFNYKSKFLKATAEECIEYINSQIAEGNKPCYGIIDEKDEVYYIVVDRKRVEIPK